METRTGRWLPSATSVRFSASFPWVVALGFTLWLGRGIGPLAADLRDAASPVTQDEPGTARTAPEDRGSAESRDAAGQELGPGVSLLDGTVISGQLMGLDGENLRLAGRDAPIPVWEIREIRTGAIAAQVTEPAFPQGPIVVFRSGERVVARVVESPREGDRAGLARLRFSGSSLPDLDVPIAALTAFRLREAHPQDDLFERDLDGGPAATDTLYLRRQGLFRFQRVFRGLDDEYVWVEDSDRERPIRRSMIQGVILAPVASAERAAQPPAILEIDGVGRLPAHVVGFEPAPEVGASARLWIRTPGASTDQRQSLPTAAIRRILPASDRVLFLSGAEPTFVEERALVGRGLAHRKDRSVAGSALTLGDRTYRRGLGVHSRTVLEYRLGGRYTTFAAVIGLDASAKGRGAVTFVVAGDGQELLRHDAAGTDPPRGISLPITGIDTLRLEVDYGPDGVDFADHADWADARVTQ